MSQTGAGISDGGQKLIQLLHMQLLIMLLYHLTKAGLRRSRLALILRQLIDGYPQVLINLHPYTPFLELMELLNRHDKDRRSADFDFDRIGNV